MTDLEHRFQHQHGELAVLQKHCKGKWWPENEGEARDWFDEQVLKYRSLYEAETGEKICI